jgi:hypothetical protein
MLRLASSGVAGTDRPMASTIAVANAPCTKKCGINGHKLLIRRRVLSIADISPVMSASIPAGSALAVSDVERVYRD